MKKKGLLLVANWDSNVGYAWWLMESFWVVLSEAYNSSHDTYLCYPSISVIPKNIDAANIIPCMADFTKKDIRSILRQCAFIIKNQITCVYFTDQPYWHWKYILYRICGVSIIVNHDHTPGLRTDSKGLKKITKSIITRLPLLSCNAIIAVSSFIKERAISVACFPRNRVFIAQNGIPPRHSSTAVDIRSIFSIKRNTKVIITTGRADKYKGIDFAIKCISHLVNILKYENIHWVFCGDGPDLDEFKNNVIQYGLSDYITLAGKRNDIDQILTSCDFALHPSHGEVGYSLSILEYMQAGLPVITSDNPSVCGATTNDVTGLIYKEDDIASACDAIKNILDNPYLIKKYGLNAKQEINNYMLENTHKQLILAMNKIDSNLSNEWLNNV